MAYAAIDSTSRQRVTEPEEYAGFWVCDPREKRIGRAQKLFVNGSGEPEYISVRMGFFGFRSLGFRSLLLPPVQDIAVTEQLGVRGLQ